LAVLEQRSGTVRQTIAGSKCPEISIRREKRNSIGARAFIEHPQPPQPVFQHGNDQSARQLVYGRIAKDPAVVHPAYPGSGAHPQAAAGRGAQTTDIRAWQSRAGSGRPLHESHSIESHQARAGAQPEISVGRLGQRLDRWKRTALFLGPTRAQVLTDGESGIHRKQRPSGHHDKRQSSGQNPAGR
jgi:hypothetical protein